MAELDKRCGTCKWWNYSETAERNICTADVPLWVCPRDIDFRRKTHRNDGEDCPCWEAKK